jgi:hypothetical protein
MRSGFWAALFASEDAHASTLQQPSGEIRLSNLTRRVDYDYTICSTLLAKIFLDGIIV